MLTERSDGGQADRQTDGQTMEIHSIGDWSDQVRITHACDERARVLEACPVRDMPLRQASEKTSLTIKVRSHDTKQRERE